jgi:hypothetical protein
VQGLAGLPVSRFAGYTLKSDSISD